jgi:hypothetical protein
MDRTIVIKRRLGRPIAARSTLNELIFAIGQHSCHRQRQFGFVAGERAGPSGAVRVL